MATMITRTEASEHEEYEKRLERFGKSDPIGDRMEINFVNPVNAVMKLVDMMKQRAKDMGVCNRKIDCVCKNLRLCRCVHILAPNVGSFKLDDLSCTKYELRLNLDTELDLSSFSIFRGSKKKPPKKRPGIDFIDVKLPIRLFYYSGIDEIPLLDLKYMPPNKKGDIPDRQVVMYHSDNAAMSYTLTENSPELTLGGRSLDIRFDYMLFSVIR